MSDAVTEWQVNEVPAATGGAWRVPAGGLVRVIDVEGGQSGDVLFVDAVDVTDGLSNGRSFDYNGTVLLTVGATLFSSKSRSLATIVQDDVGRHDFLYTPCSQEMFEIQYGVTAPHPNCYDNLTGALSGLGVPAATVTVAFNVFMCTSVAADGRLRSRLHVRVPVTRSCFEPNAMSLWRCRRVRPPWPTAAVGPDHSRWRSPPEMGRSSVPVGRDGTS